MFEITGDHIAQLNDSDLRRLVALLCEAELRQAGLPTSAVTAGGDQNAADGGIDVRVDLPPSTNINGFIPRPATGFQIKVPDMPRGAILQEMHSGGVLRPSISELAGVSGAYIIVSAQGSIADSALQDRRTAMRDALASDPNEAALYVDFYDRERLATWVRCHQGMVTWVREKIGQPIQGWRPYANWSASPEGEAYILDDTARLHDWPPRNDGPLPIHEGIQRLRNLLTKPRHVVRLVGLSGVGKTRLIQALFDDKIGADALDRSIVAYTDLADDPDPSPRELSRQFVQSRQRVIMVVDNCPPETHRALAAICTESTSLLSLITVEYDVGDDTPEGTEVFRLEPASDEVINQLLAHRYPYVSEVDRRRITEVSGGNARVALVLTDTVRLGESIANLPDQDTFKRLFHQSHEYDDNLMRAAEVCSLLYSFNGELREGLGAELPLLAELAEMSVDHLYRQIAKLRSRDLAQRRGPWRAILPQAIANRLARQALEKMHPDRIEAVLLGGGSERVRRSFSRRLGHLHDSEVARQIVSAWLSPGGILADPSQLNGLGRAMFHNVAAVVPAAALAAIEAAVNSSNGANFLSVSNYQRNTWISLLHATAYEPHLFRRAALILAHFLVVEPMGYNHESARHSFSNLFHIHLSGTRAPIDLRMQVVTTLLSSEDYGWQTCGLVALDELLKTEHFLGGSTDFGARSRDYGWHPKTRHDVESWYRTSLNLVQQLVESDTQLKDEAKGILAKRFRGLWVNAQITNELSTLIHRIVQQGFWPEGWIAVKKTIRFDTERMSQPHLDQIHELEQDLRPSDIVQQVRAYVLPARWGEFDIADAEPDTGERRARLAQQRAEQIATQLGHEVADDPNVLDKLLPSLFCGQIGRGWEFGQGLAEGTDSLVEMWKLLVTGLTHPTEREQNVQVLRGFLNKAQTLDEEITEWMLDDVVTHPVLGPWFVYLQTSISIGERGGKRLELSLQTALAPVWTYSNLRFGRKSETIPGDLLSRIILTLARMDGGLEVAVDILSARLHPPTIDQLPIDRDLIACGNTLLRQVDIGDQDGHFDNRRLDYELSVIFEACSDAAEIIETVILLCHKMKQAVSKYRMPRQDHPRLLESVVRLYPQVVLDEILGDATIDPRGFFVNNYAIHEDDLLAQLPSAALLEWASMDPTNRFPRLAAAIVPFDGKSEVGEELQWKSLALEILAQAPDRIAVLNAFGSHFYPMSWSGSHANAIMQRHCLPKALLSHEDQIVAAWAKTQCEALEQMAEQERRADRVQDERFE